MLLLEEEDIFLAKNRTLFDLVQLTKAVFVSVLDICCV